MSGLRKVVRGLALGCALLMPGAGAAVAGAQQRQLPITTGTSTSGLDAPETNKELEGYTHSPAVQAWARHLGMSTNTASKLFEDLNSGALIAVILYYLLKIVPGKFRSKRQGIDRALVEARQATADAEQRMQAVEARLQALGGEIDALRAEAAESSQREEARMRASMEEERQKIVESVQVELAATQANAERGLKRYASDLAVERAAARVELTPEGDRALVDSFLQGLAGQLGGKN